MKAGDLRDLSRGGVQLSALGMGCSQLGGLYRPMPPQQARALMDEAWSLGLRYFDTAPFYGYTLSERRVGDALSARPRDEFVLSTKVGRLLRPDLTVQFGDDGWAEPLSFRPHYDYSFDGVMRSFEDSQQRLGFPQIDLLYVHDVGRMTHGDANVEFWRQLTTGGGFRALDALRSAGQVKAFGLGVNEWQVVHEAMQEIQIDVTLLAGRYTLLEQDCLSPFLDDCVRHGNSIVAGGVFNSGVLAGNGKFNYGDAPAAVVSRVHRLAEVCREFEVPLPAAALQFPLAHPAVVSCVVGARSVEQLRQNVAWFEQTLPAGLWQELKSDGLIADAARVPGGSL
ncbi:D-threo-aldose 1-dehydrogenase [Paraburkholderia sp. BL6665CI2N2]|uniref:aldo/keto reductase n=1 Tax=Paraburkholderia sp. BL6665CI2N2 TaxID=1938806 RepID=UPI00106595E9|nr:aldo/keto reductase [Paraburkholderia sp. BL6665CI2N2]TDY23024.1 D-threo-aldose 1-dehydrogenase [Paraburkholderia sp. BL6665CI2N2]